MKSLSSSSSKTWLTSRTSLSRSLSVNQKEKISRSTTSLRRLCHRQPPLWAIIWAVALPILKGKASLCLSSKSIRLKPSKRVTSSSQIWTSTSTWTSISAMAMRTTRKTVQSRMPSLETKMIRCLRQSASVTWSRLYPLSRCKNSNFRPSLTRSSSMSCCIGQSPQSLLIILRQEPGAASSTLKPRPSPSSRYWTN